MRFTTLQETLSTVLTQISRFIPHKPTLPILSSILFEVKENTLFLSSTDLKIGVHTSFSVEKSVPGKAAIPGKAVVEFINSLSAGEVQISLEGTTVTIKGKNNAASMKSFPAGDYPTFPEKEGEEVLFTAAQFVEMIDATAFASGTDETRPVLTTTLFAPQNPGLTIVTTDGFRLCQQTFQEEHALLHPLLIPTKALQEIAKIVTKKNVDSVTMTVSEQLKQLFFVVGDTQLVVRMMEGEFPPYEKIFPSSFLTTCTFDGDELLQALKSSLIFAREASGIITLRIGSEFLEVTATASTLGSSQSQVPIQLLSGGDQEISFNSRYLLEFLQQIKPERVFFGMNESLRPALLRPEGKTTFSYLLMPFRVNK